MHLPSIVASSRRLADAAAGRFTRLRLSSICHAAVAECERVLAVRAQRVEFEPSPVWPAMAVLGQGFGDLFADAICEISALCPRGSTITVRFRRDAIVLLGRNPLDLSDDVLAIGDTLRHRALVQQIGISCAWEQGSGPALSLKPSPDRRRLAAARKVKSDNARKASWRRASASPAGA